MADTKEILLKVQAQTSDAVGKIDKLNNTIAQLKESESQLKKELKDAEEGMIREGRSAEIIRKEIIANTEAQKNYRKQIQDTSRQIQNTIISQETHKNTLKGLCAQLSIEKDKLREIKIEHGKLSQSYKDQQEKVRALNDQVKKLEQSYGVHTRNVGNYVSAFKAISAQFVAIGVAIAGLIRSIGKAMKVAIDFQQEQKNLQTILGLTNKEMKDLTQSALDLGRATEYTASQVTELQQSLARLGFTKTQIMAMSESVLALATDLDADLGASADLTGATLRAFGASANEASHYVDVLVKGANSSALSFAKYETALALVAPVASMMGFSLEDLVAILGSLMNVGMDASMSATSTRNILLKLADSSSELAKSLSKPVKDIPSLVAGLKELQARGVDVAQALELTDKRSVSAFTSLMKSADAVQNLRDKLNDLDGYAIEIRETRLETTAGQIKILQSAWEGFTLEVLESKGKLAKFFGWLADAINAVTDKLNPEEAKKRLAGELVANGIVTDWVTDLEAQAKEYAEKGLDVNKMLTAEYNRYVGLISQSLDQEAEKYNAVTNSRAGKGKKQKAKDAYDIAKYASEFQGNTLADAYTRLTEQYTPKVSAKTTTTTKDKEKVKNTSALTAFFSTATTLLSAGDDEQKIKNKYAKAEEQLRVALNQQLITIEEANYYRVMLGAKMNDELQELEQNRLDKIAEEEKAQTEREIQQRAEQLQTDLQLAWNNEEQKYQIKKAYIEKELEQENISAQRRAELEEQLTALVAENTQKKFDAVADFAGQCGDLLGEFSDVIGNLNDRELERYETDNDKQKAKLEERLNAGLISQKNYDNEVAKLDADLDKKKADIARKQAIRERALSVFEIAVNTAKAVMKIWAEVPKADFGISTGILTAMAIAQGALQSTAVLSAPLPKARKGGLVQGATHEAGGVLINTENDERIIGANPSKAFPELLNLISYIGKNVPNSGFAERVNGTSVTNISNGAGIETQQLTDAMKQAMGEVKVWLSLAELREAERNQTNISNLSKL